MNKRIFTIGAIVVAGVIILVAFLRSPMVVAPESPGIPSSPVDVGTLSHESAETSGYGFMLDFVASAPPDSDPEAMERAYEALSSAARGQVARESLVRDLALFIGVQDVPDLGVSVEDLSVADGAATLTLGLNYSGGRVLRLVHLIAEDGEWKVDGVSAGEEEPPVGPSGEEQAVAEVIAHAAAQAGVDPDEVAVVSVSANDWPDGCLGLAEPDEFCIMMIVPGYEVEVSVSGATQVYRTDDSGSVIRQAR